MCTFLKKTTTHFSLTSLIRFRGLQSSLALTFLLGSLVMLSRGAAVGQFVGENEELVPGETYRYIPALEPERLIVYDAAASRFPTSVWRYPVSAAATMERANLPTEKRAQFLRIG